MRINYLLLFIILLAGCNKVLEEQGYSIYEDSDFNNSSVSIVDIKKYLYNNKMTKSEEKIPEIVPIVAADRDTIMYLINYNNGWEIVSGDKRTPAIIAFSENGQLDMDSSNPGFLAWMNNTASNMKRIKHSADAELSFSLDEIAFYESLWSDSENKKMKVPPVDLNPGVFTGEWVYVRTEVGIEHIKVVDHLTNTQWDQCYPYNQMCPNHCGNQPAGCVAVAGAQMLYYLYKFNGKPIMATPTITMDALLTSYSIDKDKTKDVASFLRQIGDLVNMHYRDEYSWAIPSDLQKVFRYYGYSSSYIPFDNNKVEESLRKNIPVIVVAFDTFFKIPNVFTGHVFLIDGYRLIRSYTRKLYKFVPDQQNVPLPINFETYRYETKYGSSFINYVKMNWGWYSQWGENPKNDGWYGLTNDWVVNVNNKEVNYHTGMHILTDFSIIN